MSLDAVFGTKPENAIFLPASPFAVRLNCQAGQLALSETEFLGSEAEISIIKVSRYFGDLGNTKRSEWLQIFYIAAPGCTVLPSDTVCVSYIKTRSLAAFNQSVTRLIGQGVNPAEGIFKLSFVRHSSGDRNYFSVKFEWRQRANEAETNQLEMIAAFLNESPGLVDLNGTRDMICVDRLPSLLVQEMVDASREQPDLTPSEVRMMLMVDEEPKPEPEAALATRNGRKRK